ncbi:hypothetical protein BVC80_1835g175 [Macleaya cordata]|uniref:Uncharacterized protein n=1 Tax=Macleaya cordata TaxID=56857 RepID=A0A200R520_MACCD|nr:hypothetical protein BVC80_1835g175 [Macleaya cordata]
MAVEAKDLVGKSFCCCSATLETKWLDTPICEKRTQKPEKTFAPCRRCTGSIPDLWLWGP